MSMESLSMIDSTAVCSSSSASQTVFRYDSFSALVNDSLFYK